MHKRLVAFILCLPVLLSGLSGGIVLPVAGESSAHDHPILDALSYAYDGQVETVPVHDDTSHIHETMERVAAISLGIPEGVAGFCGTCQERSPVRRHYPLLRPPLSLPV